MAANEDITSINVSLPVSQRKFVESDVQKGGYASVSEYFRALIRERQDQKKKRPAPLAPENLDQAKARDAVRTILELQKKLSLKGLSVEDLINEGRDG